MMPVQLTMLLPMTAHYHVLNRKPSTSATAAQQVLQQWQSKLVRVDIYNVDEPTINQQTTGHSNCCYCNDWQHKKLPVKNQQQESLQQQTHIHLPVSK